MGTGRDMVPKEKALPRCFFTRIQGNWVIGPEPHASDWWLCCVHSRLPQTNTFLSPRWNKLKFPTVVNKTSFIPEALLRQTASIPDMTEVPCLMSPRYWMKFCFEMTTRSRVRSVSAGPVRSWGFFFPLSMLNTWPFLQRRPGFLLIGMWSSLQNDANGVLHIMLVRCPSVMLCLGKLWMTDGGMQWPGLSFHMNLCVNWGSGGVVPERGNIRRCPSKLSIYVPFSFGPVWKQQWLDFKIY